MIFMKFWEQVERFYPEHVEEKLMGNWLTQVDLEMDIEMEVVWEQADIGSGQEAVD